MHGRISRKPRARVVALLAAFALGVAPGAGARAAEIVVSAAASLADAFRDIGTVFERVHPGDKAVFNFAASDVLLTQITRGAPVDVFASADQEAMDRAASVRAIDPITRVDFARNRLVLIVPAGKPSPGSLAELAGPSYPRIALSSPASVPAGRYARGALEKAGLWTAFEPKLLPTQNVRQSLDYVARRECDAGFVYATDAAVLLDKVRIAFDVPTTEPVLYPVAVVVRTRERGLAVAFVDFLRGKAAQAILARHGFGAP